jgi:hypothetical protein
MAGDKDDTEPMSLEALSPSLHRFVTGMQQAFAKVAREWPPERILASAIAEYNRRMAEINGHR